MGYPTLINDGPFSDHILARTPLMTEGQPEVSAEQARITAANAAGKELSEMREEDSILPSYVFHDALSTSVAITKNGGYLCYLITEKPDNLTAKLSYEEAVNKAQQYLSAHGYDSMKDTYYETDNGVMTLNFAYYDSASQTICYTDLVKVEVSLQDGSILGLDARGYLVNHHGRAGPGIAQRRPHRRQCASGADPHLRSKRSGHLRIPLLFRHRRPDLSLYQLPDRCRGTAADPAANPQWHPNQKQNALCKTQRAFCSLQRRSLQDIWKDYVDCR